MTETTMDAQPTRGVDKAKIVEEWADRLQLAVIGCAVYYEAHSKARKPTEGGQAFLKPLAEKLRGSLASCVALHAQAYGDWSDDGENVGFMVKIDGASFLRAPVHLVPLIPEKRFAAMIWKLTNEVRLSKNSIMALSGSNAVRRIFEYVDDVDFFEYVPDEPEIVHENIIDRMFANGAIVCERAQLGLNLFSAPFDKPNTRIAIQTLSSEGSDHSSVKLDYLTSMVDDRPFEVTNISAFVGNNFAGRAKGKTFPFQEVLVSAQEVVPTQLDNPIQVGEYVSWLISQVQKYRSEGNYLKAAKRSLNLARFCWFDDILNSLHFLFENTTAVHEVEIRATKSALDRLSSGVGVTCQGLNIADIEDRLSLLIAENGAKKVRETKQFPDGFDKGVEEIIDKLLGRISALSGGSLANG